MVKYYEKDSIFQFNWHQVVQGFWQRYPNPISGHVLTEDTVSRKVKDGILHSTRLLTKTKTDKIPKWVEKFVNQNSVKIIEESTVDPKAKTLTTYTKNLGTSKLLSIVEKVVYKVCEDNPNWTVVKRSAWVDSQVFGFGKAIQAFGLDCFKRNCNKTYVGFNLVLARMFPHTAQFMNPSLSQMEKSAHLVDDVATKGTHTEDFQYSLQGKAEKMKDAAKKATNLAKKKAGNIYAAYQSEQS